MYSMGKEIIPRRKWDLSWQQQGGWEGAEKERRKEEAPETHSGAGIPHVLSRGLRETSATSWYRTGQD